MASSLFQGRNSQQPNNSSGADGGLLQRFQAFAQGVRLLVSTPSGVTVQSEGGSASSSDATAGNVRTLAFSDTVRVCKSCCCGKTRLSLLTTGAMTIDNVIITVARI